MPHEEIAMNDMEYLFKRPFGTEVARQLCRLPGAFEVDEVYKRVEIAEKIREEFVARGGPKGTSKDKVLTVLKNLLSQGPQQGFEKVFFGHYKFLGHVDLADDLTVEGSLQRIRIKGFRSIKEMDLQLGPRNVLIGANGAGKSNFIAFLELLRELMAGRLQRHIAETAGAAANLHFGPKKTPRLEAEIEFKVGRSTGTYRMVLSYRRDDLLFFEQETLSFQQEGEKRPEIVELGTGHRETQIRGEAAKGESMAKTLHDLLSRCHVYHFHDTSPTARIKQGVYAGDDQWLLPDAANLAAMLFRLKSSRKTGTVYRRIVGMIQQVAPFFEDFVLRPQKHSRNVTLKWRHRKSERIFGPHQISDGTLRAMCLIFLLLQPREDLPILIAVDEPELGLHPYALHVVASLFGKASHHAQLLIGTQSSAFLDHFESEDVVIVEREDEASQFERPDPDKLEIWLEDYSLGEIWEKNVFGGGPY